jgi:hypothetical protein
MTAPRDVEVLADKLTEAQREALRDACGGEGLFITRWKHGRSVRALHAKGLTLAPPPGPGGLIAVLTPLGLALRSHLIGTGNG